MLLDAQDWTTNAQLNALWRQIGRTAAPGARVDATYRYQRRSYDLTRRYYLLGRDRLIADLDPPDHGHVLKIACGTGRNLARIAARYPGRRLYGLDISEEMLRSARARLGTRAELRRADACSFDAAELFGRTTFDRIVLSYSLSMIPDWRGALAHAAAHLAPGGALHIVDFGTRAGLPGRFRTGLLAWLARFHVRPRQDLSPAVAALAGQTGAGAESRSLYRDHALACVLRQLPEA